MSIERSQDEYEYIITKILNDLGINSKFICNFYELKAQVDGPGFKILANDKYMYITLNIYGRLIQKEIYLSNIHISDIKFIWENLAHGKKDIENLDSDILPPFWLLNNISPIYVVLKNEKIIYLQLTDYKNSKDSIFKYILGDNDVENLRKIKSIALSYINKNNKAI